jgi:signal transduction histidine kinase
MEQNRREQISALAHDIKTPLTVIRGNTDLLAEMRQTAEGAAMYRLHSLRGKSDRPIYGVLLDVSRAESGLQLVRQEIVTQEFIDDLEKQSKALTTGKKHMPVYCNKALCRSFSADILFLDARGHELCHKWCGVLARRRQAMHSYISRRWKNAYLCN